MFLKQVTFWHSLCFFRQCSNGRQCVKRPDDAWKAGEVDVLKITMTETPAERRWVVQGRLVGPWVSELRTTWKRTHGGQDQRICIIDLSDVTFIDKGGERLLRALAKKGAKLIATGVYIQHVLEEVKNSCTPSAERTRRESFADRIAQTEEQ